MSDEGKKSIRRILTSSRSMKTESKSSEPNDKHENKPEAKESSSSLRLLSLKKSNDEQVASTATKLRNLILNSKKRTSDNKTNIEKEDKYVSISSDRAGAYEIETPIVKPSIEDKTKTQVSLKKVLPEKKILNEPKKIVLEEPEIDFSIDENSELYKIIDGTKLNVGFVAGSMSPVESLSKNRNRYINALIYLVLKDSELDGYLYSRDGKLNTSEIKAQAIKYLFRDANDLFYKLTVHIFRTLTKDSDAYLPYINMDVIYNIVQDINPSKQIERYIMDVFRSENHSTVRFPFQDVLRKYVFHEIETEIKFEKMLMDKMMTLEETEQISQNGDDRLAPKMQISNKYSLVKLISGEDAPVSVDNTQVWKGAHRSRDIAIKFVSIDKFRDNVPGMNEALGYTKKRFDIKKFSENKINELLKSANKDYKNRVLASSFEYASQYKEVGYSNISRACYMVMEYYPEGNLTQCTDKLISRIEALIQILGVIYSLHKLGYSFNNISPMHIMMKYNGKNEEEFHLIDFKRMTTFGEESDDPQHSGFASLNALTNGALYPYDDIESFLYVADYLISGSYPQFEDLNEEANAKETLEIYNDGIADLIRKIRDMRQEDPYVTNGEAYPLVSVDEIIDEIYADVAGLVQELLETFKEIKNIPGAQLHPSEKKLVDKIIADMLASHEFGAMAGTEALNTFALKIKNVVLYNARYPIEEQLLIDEFLGSATQDD